jgi:predicted RNase H-like nuclease (RuvC/YqgF family)
MKQEIMSMKTMLLKLRRVLNESETHIPFDGQLTNGLFNGLCSSVDDAQNDEANDSRLELAELRRQVLFLQGQLEDKEKTVQELQEQMIKLATDNYTSNSAPASTVAASESCTCNAATQTERIRPISAGPSLLNGSPTDAGNIGSLVR